MFSFPILRCNFWGFGKSIQRLSFRFAFRDLVLGFRYATVGIYFPFFFLTSYFFPIFVIFGILQLLMG